MWVIFGWDVDQWDFNLYSPTQKDCQKFVDMRMCYHYAFNHLKGTTKFQWKNNVRCFALFCHLNVLSALSTILKAQQRSNGNTMSDIFNLYNNLFKILCRSLQQLWRSPQTCDLCMLSWTCTLSMITYEVIYSYIRLT